MGQQCIRPRYSSGVQANPGKVGGTAERQAGPPDRHPVVAAAQAGDDEADPDQEAENCPADECAVTDRFTKLSRCITYAIAHVSGCLDDRYCERHGLNILTVFAARGATLPPRVNAATIPLRSDHGTTAPACCERASVDACFRSLRSLAMTVTSEVQGVRVLENASSRCSRFTTFQVL